MRANSFISLLTAAKRERVTHLFWDATTELPAYAGLHGERDIVHLGLVRAAGVLCVYECVREHLCGVPVREFEKLVQDARLRILDRGRRSQKESDGSGSGRERLCRGSRHG
jgi:hypothetical protein